MKKTISIIGLALVLVSCNNTGGNKQTIAIDGSSTVFPLTAAVAESYRKESPKTRVTIGVSGTGGGMQKFGTGKIDVANASRPISENEIALAQKNNIDFVQLEVAYDGLVVVVNPKNDWVDSLTVQQLKTIWEPAAQGKITQWNHINPEWPKEKLNLFGPGVASGTFDYFTEVIVGKSGSSRGDYMASEDDNVLVKGVASDKFGMGFFGLAFYENNKEKLKLIGVDNGQGAVIPNRETIKSGEYAPLSRPLFIYVSSKSVQNPEVVKFIRFYLRNVDKIVKSVGYIALSQEEYKAQLEKFNAFVEKYNKVSNKTSKKQA